jgi:chloramphenicol 3-O phosphotransferase
LIGAAGWQSAMGANLILITGPAAVGKSTVARGVQAELSRDGALWLVMELDVFARGLSRDWIAVEGRAGRHAERGFTYARAADGSVGLSLGPDGRRVLAAFHRAVAAMVRSGVGVICETIVYDEADWADWSDALDGISAVWVKLGAPVGVLEARETADRSPVFQGLARGMAARPAVGVFDVEADTAAETAEAIVGRIVGVMARTGG